MKAIETVLHLRRQVPRRIRSMVPPHVWALVKPYGMKPLDGETGRHEEDKPPAP
jgi:coenzyme F420 hydrogenase subunit beta